MNTQVFNLLTTLVDKCVTFCTIGAHAEWKMARKLLSGKPVSLWINYRN